MTLLQNKLTKGDNKPLDIDLTFICQYSAKQGIKVCFIVNNEHPSNSFNNIVSLFYIYTVLYTG